MTFALAAPDWVLITTDNRHTFDLDYGAETHHLESEKLLQVEDGWVTCTGSAAVFREGVGALCNVDARDLDAVHTALRQAWRRSAKQLGPSAADLGLHRFVLVRATGSGFSAHWIDKSGALIKTAELGELLLTTGGGISDAGRRGIELELRTALERVGTLPGVILAVAEAQQRLSGFTPWIGSGIRIGLMTPGANHHLSAEVDELVSGGEEAVSKHLIQVPPGWRVWPKTLRIGDL